MLETIFLAWLLSCAVGQNQVAHWPITHHDADGGTRVSGVMIKLDQAHYLTVRQDREAPYLHGAPWFARVP